MASSSDEGEIIEGGAGDLKATSLPRRPDRSGVDRQDRNRSRQSTPDYDGASRHSNSSRRSRSPRGYKRSRDDRDHYGRGGDRDQRRQRSYYDEPYRDDQRRSRVSYADLDRPPSRSSGYGNDARDRDRSRDRDRYRDHGRDRFDRRPRNRSRSPNRPRRNGERVADRFVREEHGSRGSQPSAGLAYDEDRDSQKRRPVAEQPTRALKYDTKQSQVTVKTNGVEQQK